MSKRSKAARYLMAGRPMTQDEAEAMIQEALDEHAHELAEKIRRGWDETRGATQASKVMAFAADLIDPSVPDGDC